MSHPSRELRRGIANAAYAAAVAAFAVFLVPRLGASWFSIGILALVLSHSTYYAVSAYSSLHLGIIQSPAAWFTKGCGYLLSSLLVAAALLTEEFSGVVLAASVVIFCVGLIYLKVGRALRDEIAQRTRGERSEEPTLREVPERNLWMVWAAISLSHAIVVGVGLGRFLEVYPHRGSTWITAYFGVLAVVLGTFAHRRWRKAAGTPLTPETYVSYILAWSVDQGVSIMGLGLTIFGTPPVTWIWFPVAGSALALMHRPRVRSAA